MTTQDALPDPEERVPLACDDPSHVHLTAQENQVHRLIHQGMDATEQGQLANAQAIFAQSLQLARTYTLPQWEAQSLFSHGVILDRAGQYTEAIPWFEQALVLFQTHGPIRMFLSGSIFLANMLTKTGDPERSLPILQQVKQQADHGLEMGEVPADEYEYEVYCLYRHVPASTYPQPSVCRSTRKGCTLPGHHCTPLATGLDSFRAGIRRASAGCT